MEQKFSTQDIRPNDRFSYWREAVCYSYVQLECDTTNPQKFHGQIDLKRRALFSSSFVSGSNQTVSRNQNHAEHGGETFLFSLQLRNTGFLEQSGRLAQLPPGGFGLYSSAGPYRLTLPDDFAQLVLQFPRQDFIARLPAAEWLTAKTAPTGLGFGNLLCELLPQLVRALDTTPDNAQEASQNAIIDLVVASLSTMNDGSYHLQSHEKLILLRARAYIAKNLTKPELNREDVAANVGLSVRRLNEIFQSDGSSISREIMTSRLNRIAADLANSHYAQLSVSQIAFACGIANFQSFSRAFKRQFDHNPSEFRSELVAKARQNGSGHGGAHDAGRLTDDLRTKAPVLRELA